MNHFYRSDTSRRVQLLELLVFLFLIVPSLAFSFLVSKQATVSFTVTAVATILRDLALLSLVLFFVWRDRQPRRALGWDSRNFGRELLIGVVLFVPLFFSMSYLEQLLLRVGLSTPSSVPSLTPPAGVADIVLATVLVVVVAVTEETIFRGYLCLRLEGLTRSPVAAIIISAAIFSLGHGYEGSAGVVTVGVMGAIFAIVYLWRGSLVAPVTMHFLQDFLVIVLLPHLVHRGGGG